MMKLKVKFFLFYTPIAAVIVPVQFCLLLHAEEQFPVLMGLKFPFKKKITCILSSPKYTPPGYCTEVKNNWSSPFGNSFFTNILTLKPDLPGWEKNP